MSPVNGVHTSPCTSIITGGEQNQTPFCSINSPFLQAVHHADESNWCFQKGDISVELFSTGITGFLTIFDALGSPIITEIVRRDFRGKTNGLRHSARRLRAQSLRQLVGNELKSPPRFWAASGIDCLLWSHRILRFVEQLVHHMVQDVCLELKEACLKAYRSTLAVRHNQMTRAVFERALHLVPARHNFIANLSHDDNVSEEHEKTCVAGMKQLLRATRPHITALETLFEIEGIDDDGQDR